MFLENVEERIEAVLVLQCNLFDEDEQRSSYTEL